MPSISEMIAAKAAAAGVKTPQLVEGTDLLGQPTSNRVIVMQDGPHYAKLVDSTGRFIKWLPKPEPVAYVDQDIESAINRIDPPGKSDRREAARTAARSMILTDAPLPPKAEPAPPEQTPEVRSLGSHRGEMIDLCPAGASEQVREWNQAALQPETSLCLVRDKSDPERAWIAVRMDHANRTPILLMSLPLYDATSDPF